MKTMAGLPIVEIKPGQWNSIITNLHELFTGVPWSVQQWVEYTPGNDHAKEGWQPDGTTVEDGLFTKNHIDKCLLKREVTVWMPAATLLYDHGSDHKLYWGEVLLSGCILPKQKPYYKFSRTDKSSSHEIVAFESGRFEALKVENAIQNVVIE